MKRWELLALIGLAVLAIVIGWWLIRPEPAPSPVNEPELFHPKPLLAGNGSPLPTVAPFDFLLTVQEGQNQEFKLAYDRSSRDWQLNFFGNGAQQVLRQIDGRYYYYNLAEVVWDEVDPALLTNIITEILSLKDHLLNEDQLTLFSQVAVAHPDELCQADKCAVWLASDVWGQQHIIIRVNKRLKTIYDVTIISADGSQPTLLATYEYREIKVETPQEVRYLPS